MLTEERHLLERRKKVRLRARPNLQVEPRFQDGVRLYVVKDPISLQYFYLEPAQHFALERMDGNRSLEDIRRAFEQEFKPQRLSMDALEHYAGQLLQYGLVENASAASPGEQLHQRYAKRQEWRRWLLLANVFYFKMPLLRPQRLLEALVPAGRVLFHPLTVVAALLLGLTALGLIVTRWNDFLGRLPEYRELFTWQHVFYLWLALGLVKIAHELGHAVCARVLGGEVHAFGVVLMFFFPTLYCDVTDSWRLHEKWKRLAISAAGVYVELIIATGATFVWWSTDATSAGNNFAFWLMLVCSAQTLLFNANPLMRFDGYFFLSDLLEMPNLAETAQRHCVSQTLHLLGVEAPQPPASRRGRTLLLYGAAALLYRIVALSVLLWGFYEFMKERHLAWAGFTLVLGAVSFIAGWPIYRSARFLHTQGRLPTMKGKRWWLALASTGGLAAVIFLIPFPMHVRGVGLIQTAAPDAAVVTIPGPGGFLTRVQVRDGQTVKRGDVLAILDNPQVDLDLRLNEADQALRMEQANALLGQLALLEIPGQERGALTEIRQEIRAAAQQAAAAKASRNALTLRAPCDGVIMGLPNWETRGKWLSAGTVLCHIGDPRTLRILVLLEPADRELVEAKKSAAFHCRGFGAHSWAGEVAGVAQVDADDIPPQLSQRLGGEVVTVRDPASQSEKPRRQHYLVSVNVNAPDHRLQIGTLGQVRIDVGANTLWWRARRFLGTTFNVGL